MFVLKRFHFLKFICCITVCVTLAGCMSYEAVTPPLCESSNDNLTSESDSISEQISSEETTEQSITESSKEPSSKPNDSKPEKPPKPKPVPSAPESSIPPEEVSYPKSPKGLNTVYLTFDDGPTTMTPQVLDVLKEFGVKATFYVVSGPGSSYAAYAKRAFDEGHEIAIHSACHDYKKIYASKDAFFKDFKQAQDWISSVTLSAEPTLQFRFPGGSSISKKWADPSVMNDILYEASQMGAVHNDWNVSAGDASYPRPSKERLIQNILPAAMRLNEPVILMHDSKDNKNLCAALREIIPVMLEAGYTFDTISNIKNPAQHRIYDKSGTPHSGGGHVKRRFDT